MSVISSVHTVVNFDPKISSPYSGQRLSKVIYRDKGKVKGKVSKCVSVHPLTSTDLNGTLPESLQSLLIDYLHTLQDGIIKEKVDSGLTEITDSDISISSCVSYHNRTKESDRLTSESISKWFTENVIENLTVIIAEKLGVSAEPTAIELKKLSDITEIYKTKLSKLASGAVIYESKVCKDLQKVLSYAERTESDTVYSRLYERLDKMIAAEKGRDIEFSLDSL